MSVKLQRNLGLAVIIIGTFVLFFPLLGWCYSQYSQWQLEQQWNRAVQAGSKTGQLARPPGVLDAFDALLGTPAYAAEMPKHARHPVYVRRAPAAHRPLRHPARRPLLRHAPIHHLPARRVPASSRRLAVRYPRLGPTLIEIPKIGVHAFVVEGTSSLDLARGPGHFPGTALPGAPGNFAVAGHLNVYGGWFRNLNRLSRGDAIVVRIPRQRFVYHVFSEQIVPPSDRKVLAPTRLPTVTLITCTHPATRRLVVKGVLAR